MSESRRLLFEGVTNFRDLGGYLTLDGGSTRWGLVFRSDGLHHMTASDLIAFGELGVRVVYDLRGDSERTQEPDPVDSVHIALLSRHPTAAATSVREAQTAAETAADGERLLRDQYLGMLAHSAALFGQIFTAMTRPEGLPALIHCAGGKDRTGMAAALLLSLLAVDRETVLDDYELSGTWRTVEHEQALVEVLMAAGVAYDVIVGFLGSPRWAMADVLTALDLQHGGIEPYLLGPGGMINSDLAKLRNALTTK